jgi:GrpB-like predicted nucleotidyltransferase (UPF0157 family)
LQKELDEMTPEELGRLFPIILTEHNPQWADRFEQEKRSLEKAMTFLPEFRIDHIGSTAIPDILSKPTIDILLQVPDDADTQTIIIKIQEMGFHYIPKPENPAPHMMFVKGYTNEGFRGQAFHLHVRYFGDWDELCFRDYLQKNPSVAKEYETLKKQLAVQYRNDRDGYTEAKTGFVKHVINQARKR